MTKYCFLFFIFAVCLVSHPCAFAAPPSAPQTTQTTESPDQGPVTSVYVNGKESKVYRYASDSTPSVGRYAYEPIYDLKYEILYDVNTVQFTLSQHQFEDSDLEPITEFHRKRVGNSSATTSVTQLVPLIDRSIISLQDAHGREIPIQVIFGAEDVVINALCSDLSIVKSLTSMEELQKLGLLVKRIDYFQFSSASQVVARAQFKDGLATKLRETVVGNARRIQASGSAEDIALRTLDDAYLERNEALANLSKVDTAIEVFKSGDTALDAELATYLEAFKTQLGEAVSREKALDDATKGANIGFIFNTEQGRIEVAPDVYKSTMKNYDAQTSNATSNMALDDIATQASKEYATSSEWYNNLRTHVEASGSGSASADLVGMGSGKGSFSANYKQDYDDLDSGKRALVDKAFNAYSRHSVTDIRSQMDKRVRIEGETYVFRQQPKGMEFAKVNISSFTNSVYIVLNGAQTLNKFVVKRPYVFVVAEDPVSVRLRGFESLTNLFLGNRATYFADAADGSFIVYLKTPTDDMLLQLARLKAKISRIEVYSAASVSDAVLANAIAMRGTSLQEIYLAEGVGPKAVTQALSMSRRYVYIGNMLRAEEVVLPTDTRIRVKYLGIGGSGISDAMAARLIRTFKVGLTSFSTWYAGIGNETRVALEEVPELTTVAINEDNFFEDVSALTSWKLSKCRELTLCKPSVAILAKNFLLLVPADFLKAMPDLKVIKRTWQ